MQKFLLFIIGLTLSGCVTPATFKDQKPFQSELVAGKPKELAECVKMAFVMNSMANIALAHEPGSNSYSVRILDSMSGQTMAMGDFIPEANLTRIQTRGIPYIFGDIPPYSKEYIETARKCSQEQGGRRGK